MTAKKWVSYSLLAAVAMGTTFIGTTASAAAAPQVMMIYDDALHTGFASYSWAPNNLAQTTVVHSGKQAVEMTPDRDRSLYFYKERVAYVRDYDTLQFYVNGGSTGGQQLKLNIHQGGVVMASKDFSELLPAGVPVNQWAKVELNLTDLNLPNGIFDGISIVGTTTGVQPSLYLDDFALVNKASVTPIPTVDGLTVFDDYLSKNPLFTNHSWVSHNVNQIQYVHTGIHAVQVTPDRDRSLYFYKDRFARTTDYDKLQFWVNGGETGGQAMKLVLLSGGVAHFEKNLSELLPAGIPANDWAKVELNLADVNMPYNLFDGIALVGTTTGTQPSLYIDDMVLTNKVTP